MAQSSSGTAIDLVDGAFYGGDPYPGFKWMRRHEPVYFDERNDVWGISRYEDVRAVGKDPATFSTPRASARTAGRCR